MPISPRSLTVITLAVIGLFATTMAVTPVTAATIEAVKGKEYKLTKRHGPWMIMVASFHAASADGRVKNGKTPKQVADELVYELRQKRIPAYTYEMKAGDGRVETTDKLGRSEMRKLLTNQDQFSVIAGNYPNLSDDKAQKTLEWIKRFQPKCLQQQGVRYQITKRRQGPLGGAFLTVNPLLSPEEVKARQVDPLLVRLNSGGKYSLYDNKGTYSLVVASFTGKVLTHIGDSHSEDAQRAFQIDQKDNDLDAASRNAWELAIALREREKIDAYVWHDRYQSIVTVGSFSSPNDPQLQRYLRVFAPQSVQQASNSTDPATFIGAPSANFGLAAGGSGAKVYAAGGFGKNRNESRLWAFDSQPMLMRVPQRR